MKTIEKQIQHCWKPMEEIKIDNELPIEQIAEELRRLHPNQFIIVRKLSNRDLIEHKMTGEVSDYFFEYIEKLKEDYELDIGRGDCEYGFKISPLKSTEDKRDLSIFRRHA